MTEFFGDMVSITKYTAPVIAAEGERADLSCAIQRAIDENPNRTIYFPDGVYYICKPIKTPAAPHLSVSLRLDNYAIIRADGDRWQNIYPEARGEEGRATYGNDPSVNTEFNLGNVAYAMIMLGGKSPSRDIRGCGSQYFLEGGIIDGGGVANGVGIESGRETRISCTTIKNTNVGLYIRWGANSGSADADIFNVNIICNKADSSVGLLVRGIDNTFTNMRITDAKTGVKLVGSGNFLKNIHPLFWGADSSYKGSIAFHDRGGANFYDNCYSDQFETGYMINDAKFKASMFTGCFAFWYKNQGSQTAFHVTSKNCLGKNKTPIEKPEFHSVIRNTRAGFKTGANNSFTYFKITDCNGAPVKRPKGTGVIELPIYDKGIKLTDDATGAFLKGSRVHLTSN